MSWNKKKLGIVRLLVHKIPDMAPYEYEVLESDYFSYDFYFENIAKKRPYADWMGELLTEGDHYEFFNDVFKDIKQPEFYAEVIAELHAEWGYCGGEYGSEYDENSWFENDKFRLLTDQDVKEYNDLQKPYVEPPDIVFQENTTLNDWSDSTVVEDSNSDLDTKIFFRDK